MSNSKNPDPPEKTPSSSPNSSKISGEIGSSSNGCSGDAKLRYTNPRETLNPDAATLREQWNFAMKKYSRWNSHVWGTAILAGVSFFALGWFIKGSNPLPSFKSDDQPTPPRPPDAAEPHRSN